MPFKQNAQKGRPTKDGAMTDAQRMRNYRRRQRNLAIAQVNRTPEDWVPDFPGQRPPFGPGNLAHLTHGANVPQIRNPVAEQLIAWVCGLPGNEYLREERNIPALHDWGQAQARVLLMQAYADGQPAEDALAEVTEVEETEERPSPGVLRRYSKARTVVGTWKALESAERHARAAADRIGLSPLARQKLGKQARAASADLALIWSAEDDGETASSLCHGFSAGLLRDMRWTYPRITGLAAAPAGAGVACGPSPSTPGSSTGRRCGPDGMPRQPSHSCTG